MSNPFARALIRLLTILFAALTGAIALLFFITSGGRARPILLGLVLVAAAVLFLALPSLLARLRRLAAARVRRDPEDSQRLRIITFAGQVIGVIALAQPTQLWLPAGLALAVLALGHRYAYYHRAKPDRRVQIVSFAALHLVFCYLFVLVFSGGVYPQAQVAMLAMAVVSWEIISRLNLYSCFGMSLICLYVAATLSRDLTLGAFLLIYLGILLAFLWQADSEDGVKDNPVILRQRASDATAVKPSLAAAALRAGSVAIRFGPALLGAAALVFIFTPHFASAPLIPPITLRLPINRRPSAQIINPALPVVQIEGLADPNARSEYYYGFDSTLDLTYRGGLTDTIMMYVRSPAAAYWRSHAFDHYDGRSWTQTDPSLTPITSPGGRYLFDLVTPPARGATFVQSFFIAQPLPNVIFTGGSPVRLLFPAEEISRDSTGGLRAPETLAAGTQYTVYARAQDWSPAALRGSGVSYPKSVSAANLQIPPTTPARVFDLARRLTADNPTAYDKVVTLRDYLKATYPYDYFPPPQAPNTDSVDQFLFVDKRGVCEHYVSALVIMLRSLGIPSRLAAGYGSGTYNAITGYYEVHANDAHAWAEVYFPRYGWAPFDPTPGWTGDPRTGPIHTWIFSSFTDQLDLPRLPVGELASAGLGALAGVGWPLAALGLAALFGAGVWVFWTAWRRYRLSHPPRPAALRDHPNRRRILAVYRQAQRTLHAPRAPAQTAQEHAAAQPALADLAQAVDVAAYRPEPPSAVMVQKANRWNRKS